MMNWDTPPMRFWDGVYEHPRERFRARDESRLQAEYMLKHPEIRALATLLIAHMSKKPTTVVRPLKTLEETARFYLRPADVLQAEAEEFLKKAGRVGPKPEMAKKHDPRVIPRPESVPECECPKQNTPSIESFYSSFITISTSATTLPSDTNQEPVTPTIEQTLVQFVLRSLNKALDTLYAARDHEIIYDEAYLCISSCIQTAVEEVWIPILEEINDFFNVLLGEVPRICLEKRNQRIRMTNKVPKKVNRLKNNFKGFVENEEYPILKRKDIHNTIVSRQGTFNRYPKDEFGVYISKIDDELNDSVTIEPSNFYFLEEEESNFEEDVLEIISAQNEEPESN